MSMQNEELSYERKGTPEFDATRVKFGGFFFTSQDKKGIVYPHISFLQMDEVEDVLWDYPEDPWSAEELQDIIHGELSESLIAYLSQSGRSYQDKYGFIHQQHNQEDRFYCLYFAAIDGDVSNEIDRLENLLALPEFLDPNHPDYAQSQPYKNAILEAKSFLEDPEKVNDALKSCARVAREMNGWDYSQTEVDSEPEI